MLLRALLLLGLSAFIFAEPATPLLPDLQEQAYSPMRFCSKEALFSVNFYRKPKVEFLRDCTHDRGPNFETFSADIIECSVEDAMSEMLWLVEVTGPCELFSDEKSEETLARLAEDTQGDEDDEDDEGLQFMVEQRIFKGLPALLLRGFDRKDPALEKARCYVVLANNRCYKIFYGNSAGLDQKEFEGFTDSFELLDAEEE